MATVMTEKDPADEELVIVETPPAGNAPADGSDDDRDDSKPAENATSDEDDRLSNAGPNADDDFTDEEREAIRERRRLEKAERKERREKAISRDKLELDFLRKRNDDLERRLSGVEKKTYASELSTLDSQIAQARNDAEMAERVIAKAVEAGNGADVAQALKYRDQAMQRAQQLAAAKQQTEQRPTAEKPALDDLTAHYAGEFMRENKWYDAQGRDEDSAIMLAIDQGLARDGFNPQTPEYWDELRSRGARRLPERFKADRRAADSRADAPREERTPRGGPSVGSGREHAPASTRREVYISPERKQAMIEAGVWDDPVLRMKYVKRYSEYDRANRA